MGVYVQFRLNAICLNTELNPFACDDTIGRFTKEGTTEAMPATTQAVVARDIESGLNVCGTNRSVDTLESPLTKLINNI